MAKFSFENEFAKALNGTLGNDQNQEFKDNGFIVPNAPASDGIGLPFTKVPPTVPANSYSPKRHLIHWLIPDMGVVKVYVNPESITYSNKKLIQPQRTKNGYTIQYWGEDLTRIQMNGTTGRSGIEGINMLYEVYRSEQYTFDSVGLSLSASNAIMAQASSISNYLVGAGGAAVGGLFGGAGDVLGGELAKGLFGADQSNNLAPRNIPSLANNAFTVEMYYNGWVYRGYFDSMNITETTDLLFKYDITFMATQRRGYRTNAHAWQTNPNGGGGDGSNDDANYSFKTEYPILY